MRGLGLFIVLALGCAAAPTGAWEGDWTGASGAGGSFRIAISEEAGKLQCDVVFGLGANQVKTKTNECRIDGARLVVRYEFEIAANPLESTLTAEFSGNALKGTYKTKALADSSPVDEGELKAAKKQSSGILRSGTPPNSLAACAPCGPTGNPPRL